eukprot:6173659-Pleurochrysis_carterae.AAC.1
MNRATAGCSIESHSNCSAAHPPNSSVYVADSSARPHARMLAPKIRNALTPWPTACTSVSVHSAMNAAS